MTTRLADTIISMEKRLGDYSGPNKDYQIQLIEWLKELSGTRMWREAVIDELVTCGIYSTVHDNEPRKAVNDAINWNVQAALDPLVSEAADNLLNGWSSWIMQARISELESRLSVALCNEQATHEANKRMASKLFEVEGVTEIFNALEE